MLPLSVAEIGQPQIIKRIGGNPDVKQHLENLSINRLIRICEKTISYPQNQGKKDNDEKQKSICIRFIKEDGGFCPGTCYDPVSSFFLRKQLCFYGGRNFRKSRLNGRRVKDCGRVRDFGSAGPFRSGDYGSTRENRYHRSGSSQRRFFFFHSPSVIDAFRFRK